MNQTGVLALGVVQPSGPLSQYFLAALAILFSYVLGSYLSSPLRQYPGPFLAKFTNFWRLYHTSRGNFQHDLGRLHKKYGPVVRIGPNILDVDDATLLKTVFGIKGEWKKTGLYQSVGALVNGQVIHNVFSQPDEAKHTEEKKPIAKYYSPAGVTALEPLIDKTVSQLCDELDKRFVGTNAVFDLGDWILYYAWDVVGTVTFSQPFGYLSEGRDFDGTLRASEKTLDYFSWVGCMPIFDTLLQKNRIAAYITTKLLRKQGGFNALAAECVKRLIARLQGTDRQTHSPSQPDYLDRFLEVKAAAAADPKSTFPVDDTQVVSWIMINLGAGADTTAISIRSALYYSLRTPGVWSRLCAELDSAGLFASSSSSSVPVSHKQARRLPYLEAIVRESIRYLPGVSLGMERYVPPGGQRVCGTLVPQGTILAFNPWIINRNESVFGPDSHEFRPERWLRGGTETEAAFSARLRAMNDTDLSFGAGKRMCIGKHFGVMQVFKVVATLAVRYEIELVDKEKEWTVVNSWFPRQKGLVVRMRRRGG